VTAFYTAICTKRVLLVDWPLAEAPDVSLFLNQNYIDWKVPQDMIPTVRNPRISKPLYSSVDNYNNPFFIQLQIPVGFHDKKLIDMRSNLWAGAEKGDYKVNDTECIQRFWANEPATQPGQIAHYEKDDFLFRMGFWTMFVFSNSVHTLKRSMQEKTGLLQHAKPTSRRRAKALSRHGEELIQQQNALEYNAKQPFTDTIASFSSRRRAQETVHAQLPMPLNEMDMAGQTTMQPYIAVHIRTGIGSSWNDPLRHSSENEFELFYQCAKRMQSGIMDRQQQAASNEKCQNNPKHAYQRRMPAMPIYVAADNVIAKQALMQLDATENANDMDNRTIRAIEDMQIYHIDRSRQQGNQAENSVWAELNVLLEATCLVTSRSGFSDLAKWLQPTPFGRRCAIRFSDCQNEMLLTQALEALDFSCS
jgi:hypothetical protein